jgi:hypothetical protein
MSGGFLATPIDMRQKCVGRIKIEKRIKVLCKKFQPMDSRGEE